jgi:hypothetical protein
MTTPDQPTSASNPSQFSARLGYCIASTLAVLTIASFAIGIATPPRSGPFCVAGCVAYPYAAAAPFFPRDYLWMYPAILLTPLFVILAACIHAIADERRKTASVIGVAFASIAATLITADYAIQLEVIAPSLIKGEMNGVAVWTQYNPHGIYIALEDIGFLMLSLSFLFIGMALARHSRLERVLRRILMGSAVLAVACYIGMMWAYGVNLETRFEITVITITWTVLAIAGAMMAIHFARSLRAHSD